MLKKSKMIASPYMCNCKNLFLIKKILNDKIYKI